MINISKDAAVVEAFVRLQGVERAHRVGFKSEIEVQFLIIIEARAMELQYCYWTRLNMEHDHMHEVALEIYYGQIWYT